MGSKRGRRNVLTSFVLAIAVCVKSLAQGFNSPPTAFSDSTRTQENVAVTINIVANDRDSSGNLDPSTVDLDTNLVGIQKTFTTAKGEYSVSNLGVLTFTPATGYFGRATIQYNVRDSLDAVSNNANINIDVEAVNTAPVATADTGQTNINAEVSLNILANDSDPDGSLDSSKVDLDVASQTVQKDKKTPEGDWSVNKGVLKFKPKKDFSGTAKLDYRVADNEGEFSNVVSVTITVIIPNAAPVAANDTGTTSVNKPVAVNVVANDTDSDGTIDANTVDLNVSATGIQKTANTAQGSWSVNATGVVTYTPIALFSGSATLSYVVSDNKATVSNAATITITVQVLNAAPVAVNDNATTTKNKAVTIKVTDNDSDSDGTLDVTKVDINTTQAGIQKTNETTQGNYSVDNAGVVTFTPANNFTGAAALTYTVNDNSGATSNQALINITVQNVNSAPVAVNDSGATSANTATTVNVVANDTDSDGVIDAAKVDLNTLLAGVQSTNVTIQGAWSVSNLGIVTYTPTILFTGSATLNYTVSDNNGAASNVATITIAVQPVNAPIAIEDTVSTKANTAVNINVVANDRDTDGKIDVASVDLNTTTAGVQNTATTDQGEFSSNPQGVVKFTPKKDFFGTAQVKYTVKDDKGVLSNEANIIVTVEKLPDTKPVATDDVITTKINVPVTINVVANDRDSDGSIDVASVDLNVTTNGVQNTATTPEGEFSVSNAGLVRFVPKTGFIGAVTLKYTVKDDKGLLSNAANIIVTVEEVPNVAPVISSFEDVNDTLRYTPGRPIAITGDFEVTDADDDSLAVAEIGIDNEIYTSGDDILLFEDTPTIKGAFDLQTGILKLTGLAPIADYNAAIRSVQYNFTGKDELDENIKRIYIRVSDGNSFGEMKERVIKVNSALSDLDIPTAFTPNNDGANDTWKIQTPSDITGSDFATAEVRVYDKKGTVVYGVNGLGNTWDGTYQGKQLPVDTYYYIIDLKQQQKRYRGVVAILR